MLLRLALAVFFASSFAPAALADAFSLTLHANGGADITLYRGEPLLVQALLILNQDEPTTVSLEGDQPWTRALTPSLLDGAGQTVPLQWALLGEAPAARLAFTPEATEISAVLSLPPASLDALQPGDYRLDAVFSTEEIGAPGAWKGEVRASGVTLRLSADPRANTAAEQVYRQRLLARWHQLSDRPEEALRQLDHALVRMPGDVQVLSDKSELLLEMNRGNEAIVALQQAVSLYRQNNPDANHPPRWLLRQLRDLDASPLPAIGAGISAELLAQNTPPVHSAPANSPPAAAPPAVAASSLPSDDSAAGLRHWVGDQAVAADLNGQWAVRARAGTQYGDVERSAARATGEPDVPGVDDHPNAWCPAVRDSGSDWLELSFARVAPATEVLVRQSSGPGAIVKVEAIEPDGQVHTWWEGVDPYGQDGFAEDAVWFTVRVPLTNYDVQKIRLTLNLGAHGRWKQIDAVQLVGETSR